MLPEKTCTECGATKPADQFYRWNRGRDGRRPQCADCCRARQRDAFESKKTPRRIISAVCAYEPCGEPFEYEKGPGPRRIYHLERCKYLAGEEKAKSRAAVVVRACACGSTDVNSVGKPVCPDCKKDRTKRNAETVKAKERRRILRLYNVTQEWYDATLAAQGGKCGNPQCENTEPGGIGTWKIDHDHACCPGKGSCGRCVRGLLCNNCNMALGYVSDSMTKLQGLLEYRKAHTQASLLVVSAAA